MTEKQEQGRAVRRRVLGEAHVAQAEAATTPLDADFQRFVTEGAWGSVWARPGLGLRERSLVTLALLAAQGSDAEFVLHLRATARTGASAEDVAETLLHVAVYAGVPRANHAMRLAKQVFAEMEAGE